MLLPLNYLRYFTAELGQFFVENIRVSRRHIAEPYPIAAFDLCQPLLQGLHRSLDLSAGPFQFAVVFAAGGDEYTVDTFPDGLDDMGCIGSSATG